jgi:O-antigen ligase
MYLVTLILTAVALFPFVRRQTRLALTAFLVPAGAMLVLTYTRSAWISLVAGVLVIGLIHRKRVLAVAGIAVILVVLTVPSIAGRFQDLETSTRSSGTAANSLVWRLGYWDQALQLSHNPFIGEGLRTVAASTDVAKEPHNDFIRVYVEMGLVGMAAYLWLLGTMVRVAARGLRTATAGIHRGIVVAFTAMLSAFLLLSLVSNVITQLVVLWYVAALAAAALAAQRLHTHALAPAFAPLPSPIENPPRQ